MSVMSSFYGGRSGASFKIVKTFDAISSDRNIFLRQSVKVYFKWTDDVYEAIYTQCLSPDPSIDRTEVLKSGASTEEFVNFYIKYVYADGKASEAEQKQKLEDLKYLTDLNCYPVKEYAMDSDRNFLIVDGSITKQDDGTYTCELIERTSDNEGAYDNWKALPQSGEPYRVATTIVEDPETHKNVEKGVYVTQGSTDSGIEGMIECFSKGGMSTNEVNYGEYVLIDTVANRRAYNDPDNGKIFRRGMDYANSENAGAEYIGQIVGPKGEPTGIRMGTLEDVNKQLEENQNRFSGQVIRDPSEYLPFQGDNKGIVPGMKITTSGETGETVVEYRDSIKYNWVAVRNENGTIQDTLIAFEFPYLVPEFHGGHRAGYYETADFFKYDQKTGKYGTGILSDSSDIIEAFINDESIGNVDTAREKAEAQNFDLSIPAQENFKNLYDTYFNKNIGTANVELIENPFGDAESLNHPFYKKWTVRTLTGTDGDDIVNLEVVPTDILKTALLYNRVNVNNRTLSYESEAEQSNFNTWNYNTDWRFGLISWGWDEAEDPAKRKTLPEWFEGLEGYQQNKDIWYYPVILRTDLQHQYYVYAKETFQNQLRYKIIYHDEYKDDRDFEILDAGANNDIKDMFVDPSGVIYVTYSNPLPSSTDPNSVYDQTSKYYNAHQINTDTPIIWIDEISLNQQGEFKVGFNNDYIVDLNPENSGLSRGGSGAIYKTNLRWVADVGIDKHGEVKIIYNRAGADPTSEPVEKIAAKLKSIKDIRIDIGSGFYPDEVDNSENLSYNYDQEGKGDQKVHITYNTGQYETGYTPAEDATEEEKESHFIYDTEVVGQPLNYIADFHYIERNDPNLESNSTNAKVGHLIAYFSDPEYRNQLFKETDGGPRSEKRVSFKSTKTGKLIDEWYDLGPILPTDSTGLKVIGNIRAKDDNGNWLFKYTDLATGDVIEGPALLESNISPSQITGKAIYPEDYNEYYGTDDGWCFTETKEVTDGSETKTVTHLWNFNIKSKKWEDMGDFSGAEAAGNPKNIYIVTDRLGADPVMEREIREGGAALVYKTIKSAY